MLEEDFQKASDLARVRAAIEILEGTYRHGESKAIALKFLDMWKDELRAEIKREDED